MIHVQLEPGKNQNFQFHLMERKLHSYMMRLSEDKVLYKQGEESIYADIFPQKHNQIEDMLTENNVKGGYSQKSVLSNETISGYDIFNKPLKSSLHLLSSLGGDLLGKPTQLKEKYVIPNSKFKLPEKVFMPEVRKDNWITDLKGSNHTPDLTKIPSGLKIDNVLELCITNLIPHHRALWLIKCAGIYEIRSQKSNLPPQEQYLALSFEFTKTIKSCLLHNLGSLYQRKLSKPENESIFHSKIYTWKYLITLCHEFYHQGLIHNFEFLNTILAIFKRCSNKQLPGVIYLLHIFLPEFSKSRYLALILLSDCISKCQDPKNAAISKNLVSILKVFFINRQLCVYPLIVLCVSKYGENISIYVTTPKI
jgi:hypothetical protein